MKEIEQHVPSAREITRQGEPTSPEHTERSMVVVSNDQPCSNVAGLPTLRSADMVTEFTGGNAAATCFDANEITELPLPNEVSTQELQRRCAEYGGNRGVFANQDEVLARGLEIAHPLYLRIKDDVDAVEQLRTHPPVSGRTRLPSARKPALLACFLTLKPEDARHTSLCSVYADALLYAVQQSVQPVTFAEWFAVTTLTGCIKAVRKVRRDAIGQTASVVRNDSATAAAYLECRIGNGTDSFLSVNVPIPAQHFEAVADVIGGCPDLQPAERLRAIGIMLTSTPAFIPPTIDVADTS